MEFTGFVTNYLTDTKVLNKKLKVFRDFVLHLTTLSKCTQFGTAAIIVNEDMTQVYSIGINGGPKGGVDCLCVLEGKETCIHAETQAIAKCTAVDKQKIMICSLSPCVTCASLIINNGFRKVYYIDTWKNTEGIKLLTRAGIQVLQIDKEV